MHTCMHSYLHTKTHTYTHTGSQTISTKVTTIEQSTFLCCKQFSLCHCQTRPHNSNKNGNNNNKTTTVWTLACSELCHRAIVCVLDKDASFLLLAWHLKQNALRVPSPPRLPAAFSFAFTLKASFRLSYLFVNVCVCVCLLHSEII